MTSGSVERIPEVPSPATKPGIEPEAPTSNVLIARIGERADLSVAAAMPRGPERKQAVYDALVATAKSSQVDALAALEGLQKSGDVTAVESLFLPNAIMVTTKAGRHQAVADALAGLANVKEVAENRTWSVQGALDEETVGSAGAAAGAAFLAYAKGFIDGPAFMDPSAGRRAIAGDAPSGGAPATEIVEPDGPKPEWGVAKIGAPAAWAEGIDGTGVTIGIVDTGLDAEHAAIKPHYRGTNADGSMNHDYNWYDPFEQRATPYDDGDHGTHVAGSSAGGTDSRAIGVAPGAKLIAAKAINGRGYNTTAATLKALQFMLAPTKTDGTAADPTKGADVINNSWGNADQADETFIETFEALKAAGIELVNAAGNDGPREGTVSPPGSYPGYLSVAATTTRDDVARFSSRGPSKFATPEEMTPNVAAPGAGVVSSVPGGRFQSMSGTSMAAPHVAGAVALLLQAAPQATHEQIVDALTGGAVDIDRAGPDNASGFGRIDVPAALERLRASIADASAGAQHAQSPMAEPETAAA
jgi:subtilisin family serine protease